MAADHTQELQRIVDSDPELQRLMTLGRSQGASFKGGSATDLINKRLAALGFPNNDYALNVKTGQVARDGYFYRNADWIVPAAVGATGAAFGLAGAGGAAAAGSAGAPGVAPVVAGGIPGATSTSGALAAGTMPTGIAGAGATTPLWSQIGNQVAQPSRWAQLGQVLGNAGQAMTSNRGAQDQEDYLRDALMLNAKSQEAQLEHTYRNDAKGDIRRSDWANAWTPTERPAGVPTISFTHGPGPQEKVSDQALATQGLDRLSKPPIGLGSVDPNDPNSVLPYATTPPRKPSLWEQLATYGGPVASILGRLL